MLVSNYISLFIFLLSAVLSVTVLGKNKDIADVSVNTQKGEVISSLLLKLKVDSVEIIDNTSLTDEKKGIKKIEDAYKNIKLVPILICVGSFLLPFLYFIGVYYPKSRLLVYTRILLSIALITGLIFMVVLPVVVSDIVKKNLKENDITVLERKIEKNEAFSMYTTCLVLLIVAGIAQLFNLHGIKVKRAKAKYGV